MKKKIVNPHWTNNARNILAAEFHYDDGKVMKATISNEEGGNPDWDEIMSLYSAEELEKNTQKRIAEINAERERKKQQEEAIRLKKYNEDLFAVKLKAFEVEGVKNSVNRAMKSRIRRAKSEFEVLAYTAALLLKEDQEQQTTE